jgi:hypothetical protein
MLPRNDFINQIIELLEEIEWANHRYTMGGLCPCCWSDVNEKQSHDKDCKLYNVLTMARQLCQTSEDSEST